jgi:hypothetical protein
MLRLGSDVRDGERGTRDRELRGGAARVPVAGVACHRECEQREQQEQDEETHVPDDTPIGGDWISARERATLGPPLSPL